MGPIIYMWVGMGGVCEGDMAVRANGTGQYKQRVRIVIMITTTALQDIHAYTL